MLSVSLALAMLRSPALAQDADDDDVPDWVLGMEGEPEPAKDPAPWPLQVRLDTASGVVSMDWQGNGAPPEWVALEDIAAFERARPWEGHPDELFLALKSGRRVLVARGEFVNSNTLLIAAFSRIPVKELPPGEGHFSDAAEGRPAETGRPAPTLAIGSASGGLAIKPVGERTSLMPETKGVVTVSGSDGGEAIDESKEGGGEIERQDVDGVIKAKVGVFHRCYQRELQRNPGLSGRVVLRFVIDRDGSVKLADIKESTLGNEAVEMCLIAEITRTRFPKPKGNGTAVVAYPFTFSGE